MPAAANSVGGHLPDAVLDAAESILYARYSTPTVEERYGSLVPQ